MSDRVAVLNGGRIQQLDTPRAIYDRPANTFVATFVGASNLFEGQFDGHQLITADGLSIRAAADGPALTQTATALIRPEQFVLGGASDWPSLDVAIEQIIFVGAAFELHGHTQEGRKVIATIPAASAPLIGTVEQERRAQLRYDPASVHIIRPQTAEARP